MKKIFSILILTGFVLVAASQENDKRVVALNTVPDLTVSTGTLDISKSPRPSFIANIKAEQDDVAKKWKKYISEQCSCDFKKKKGMYSATGITVPSISAEVINMHWSVVSGKDGSRLNAAVDMGSAYLSQESNAIATGQMKSTMSNFMRNFYAELYDDVIKDQEKILSSAVKEHESMIKEGEKISKGLNNERESITKSESAINKAESQITELQRKIEDEKAAIAESKKSISDLEKQQVANAESKTKQKAKVDSQKGAVDKLKANSGAVKAGMK